MFVGEKEWDLMIEMKRKKNHESFLVSSENSMILMNLKKERIKPWVIDNRDKYVYNYIWNRLMTWK